MNRNENIEEWEEFQRRQHIKTFTSEALYNLISLETEFKIIFNHLKDGGHAYDYHEILKRIETLQMDMANCINAQYGNSYKIP